jgi:uncharacterized membrane protein
MFTGYNLVEVEEKTKVLATFKETGDPMIIVWNYEKGRTMAITTGIAPHWGSSFRWKYCERFLDETLNWLAAFPAAG